MKNSKATRTQSSSKIDEITKMFLRKIRSIDYKNVKMISGYEETELKYKNLRETLDKMNEMIKGLKSYEYGSKLVKTLKKGLQYISDKSHTNIYKNIDLYEEVANVGSHLARYDGECKNIGEKVSLAFKNISNSKKVLNTKLEEIRLQLKELRSETQEIDSQRKKVKNMRFDLEVMLQDGGYNDEIRTIENRSFEETSKKTMKSMQSLILKPEIPEIIKEIVKEYRTHLQSMETQLSLIR